MQSFTVAGLEVQIEEKRCRLINTIAGEKKVGEWKPLPLHESDLSLSTTPASDLAIAVAAHDRLSDTPVSLRDLLVKPK
jgi:hypothetical protein